ncbi:MAG TPA: 3-dehydroquinate synthase [Elusimicrobiota bacterium]|nr:3-dehydroquinate synthase [Elusimicrobiota bacterium]
MGGGVKTYRFAVQAERIHSDIVVNQPLEALPKSLNRWLDAGARIGLFCDGAVASGAGRRLAKGLAAAGYQSETIVIQPGESSKSLAAAGRSYRKLARMRFERRSALLALGGGVVGDLTGFIAATYLRGVPYIQAPTTLLAQVDASIGGKTAVDIPEGKNLVGAFYHPRAIWIDPTVLKTLPKEHWRNGLAEVIKYGAIRDAELFARLEHSIDALVKGYSPEWVEVIARCARIKAQVVSKDPEERKGLRALLNFGHTVGHAIEAATNYRGYLHGEAISIGMFVAGSLSERMGLIGGLDRIRLGTLLTKAGLPARVRSPIARARLFEFLNRDKKVERGSVRFVLLKGIGEAVSGQEIPNEALDSSLAASGL